MSEQGAPPLGLDRTALMLFLAPYCKSAEAAKDAANALVVSDWMKDRDANMRLLGAVLAGETCPTACVEANHPGTEHEQWVQGAGGQEKDS